MLKAKNQIQNGAVAQLGERFNGIEQFKYPNLNTNKIHTGHCFQVECANKCHKFLDSEVVIQT